jgi:hypothetical protein
MEQTVINWLLGGFGALIGFVLAVVWQELKDLKNQDIKLAEKVSAIETLVAGKYVTREEFSTHMDALFRKLDRIDEKLDKKADK